VERPALEVADIFRDFGPAWRDTNRGHVSHAQLKVMSAIEACRTAALGGYVARCQNAECGHTLIASFGAAHSRNFMQLKPTRMGSSDISRGNGECGGRCRVISARGAALPCCRWCH